jgi:hypothetical protein
VFDPVCDRNYQQAPMYPNLPDTAFWVVCLFVLACGKFNLAKSGYFKLLFKFFSLFLVSSTTGTGNLKT